MSVVGGGIHGATVALFTARGGMSVALIERDQVCRGASGVNAGTLTMQMTRVALIPYALKAHAMWASAREWLGHDVGVVVCDGLSLAFTGSRRGIADLRAGKRREAGAPIEVDFRRDRRKRSSPASRDDVRVAGWCKVDGYANAYLTGLAFRRAMIGAGVALHEQTAARGIVPQGRGYRVETSAGAIVAATACDCWRRVDRADAGLARRCACRSRSSSISSSVTERIAPVMRTQSASRPASFHSSSIRMARS